MAGPRANYIFVEHGEILTATEKYGGESIPDLMMSGEEAVVSWLRSVAGAGITLYDSADAEGALLVNKDAHLLVAGFLRWGAEWKATDPFSGLRDYHYFHRYKDLQTAFLELSASVWPGWTVLLARKSSFGTRECLCIEREHVQTILPSKKRGRNSTGKPVQENFMTILSSLIPPKDYQALENAIARASL